jgi:hypothetical protein
MGTQWAMDTTASQGRTTTASPGTLSMQILAPPLIKNAITVATNNYYGDIWELQLTK